MVHLHHHDSDDKEEAEPHHVSIASLRSKFENLAHGTHNVSPRPPGKLAPAAPSPSVAAASPVPPRVITPTAQSAVSRSTSAQLPSVPIPPRSVSVNVTPLGSPQPSSILPVRVPGPVPPRKALSTIVPEIIPPRAATSPSSRPSSTAPPAPPQAKPNPASHAASKSESALSTGIDTQSKMTTGTEAEDEAFQSVKDLRQRFGTQTTTPRPAKSPNLEGLRATNQIWEQQPLTETRTLAPSAQVPPKPRPLPSPFASHGSTPSVGKPLSASPPPSLFVPSAKPPPPKPPISRSNSPVPTEKVAGGQLAPSVASTSRSNSPATGSRPAPPPPPAARAQFAPSPSPASSRSSSPALGHRPAPPPPRIASVSPLVLSTSPPPTKPPLPVRKASLPPAGFASETNLDCLSASFVSSGLPPPIPANRPKSSSNASSTIPSPPAPAPPPLPQTKRPVIVTGFPPDAPAHAPPPPLPKTARPTEAAVQPVNANPANSAPPPLPLASKRPDAPPSSAAPRLPTRRPTLDSIPFPPPPSAPPLGNKGPSLSRPKEISLPLPDPSPPAAPIPYRPRASTTTTREPLTQTQTAPPRLPTRRGSNVVGEGEGYQPPPPPMRNNNPPPSAFASPGASLKRSNTTTPTSAGAALGRSNSTAVSLKRNGTTSRGSAAASSHRGGGDSDDDEEGGGAQPLTTMAQRLLDEHPDSTQANRRPPQFSPHVKISTPQSITAFAAHGRYGCVAHHSVKVFDTQLSGDQPILTFDQRDTGMETRSKEPRITAMGFRPSSDPDLQGRYLWCGNKDGHLWELDIQSGEVTAKKPGIHGGAVTHIMHHGLSIVTIDDMGKLHIWDTAAGAAEGTFKVTRTLRISDKVTFAKMIQGRLWTAVAPVVRSATNTAASRGPTVRVYDLTVPGNVPPPLVALTTEWTGAATSATVMPLGDPNEVFIGHEGGFVSIWSTTEDQLICQHVLKVASTDILSLEGVGERLWAGNRRGQIHVWNITEKPWRTSNVWTAHDEQPIQTLAVDPGAIDATGRFMLWSVSRDSVQAWDGLLAVDWIDKQMVERQPQYCDFREVRVLVCSWNIDSSKPTDLVGSTANVTFLDQVLNSVDSPDIIVFGFQEVVPLTDKKLTAKTLLFGHKGKDGGGATNDRVSERYRAWADKLQHAVRLAMPQETPYVKVHSEQLVGLFTCMFVKQCEREALRDVKITTVKRGIGGIYGNKGAIVARMVIDDTSMCFINVHLAAGQSHRAARTADLAAIMEDKAIFPPADKQPYVNGGNGTGILDHEMVVLNGDLNYRIDQRREVVISSIQSGDLDFLLPHDQLHKEMRGNHAFRLRSFAEPPITFAPTYKYDPGTNNYDSSDKRRIPAWCDRVLYLKNERVHPLNYQRYEITCSDHKPVSAGLAMQVKRINADLMRATYKEILQDWVRREADMLPKIAAAYAALY